MLAPMADANPAAAGDWHDAHAGRDAGPAWAQESGVHGPGGAHGGVPAASSAVTGDPAHDAHAQCMETYAQQHASSASRQPPSMWDSSGPAGGAGAGNPAASLRGGGGYFARGGSDTHNMRGTEAAAVSGGSDSAGSAAAPPAACSTEDGAGRQWWDGMVDRPAVDGDRTSPPGEERGGQGGGPLEGPLVGSVEVSLAASTRTRTLMLNAPDVRRERF